MQGWIKIHRQVLNSWISEDLEKFGAWVQLIALANHADSKVLIGNKLIDVKRGSFITSKRKLQQKWGWSREKLEAFFTLLKADHMTTYETTHQYTYVSIINYDTYQDLPHTNTHTKPQKNHKRSNIRSAHDYTTNKNDKNEENDKNKESITPLPPSQGELKFYGKILKTSEEEFQKLTTRYGKELIDQELPDADEWLEKSQTPNARKYRKNGYNHYLFFNGWLSKKSLKGALKPREFKTIEQQIRERNEAVFKKIEEQAKNDKQH